MNPLFAGKTIQRTETHPPSPYDGKPDQGRIVLHFTDGTMIELIGEGDDYDNSISAQTLEPAEHHRRLTLATEHQKAVEQRKRDREAWLNLTCQERETELAAKRADENPVNAMIRKIYGREIRQILTTSGSILHGQAARTVHDPCPKCEETSCPNAPTRHIPARGPMVYTTSDLTLAPQTRTKARRN